MKATLIILFIIVLVVIIFTIYQQNKKANDILFVPNRETDYMKEWKMKVANAVLYEDVYNKSNKQDKYDLIYYYIQKIIGEHSIEQLPHILKVFYMIDILETQVNNGGFHQLFTNSSGEYIYEIHQSLGLIKASHTQSLLEQASSVMLSFKETPESLNKQLQRLKPNRIYKVKGTIKNEELYEQLNKIDIEFFKYKDNLLDLTLEFIDENQNQLWKELNIISNK